MKHHAPENRRDNATLLKAIKLCLEQLGEEARMVGFHELSSFIDLAAMAADDEVQTQHKNRLLQ